VLVTGANGSIGSFFAAHSHETYELRLMVREGDGYDDALERYGEVREAVLSDLDAMKELCDGIDTVVHLAANPSPHATWASVRDDNITGTYNACVAAKAAGCRRLIYASSIHAVSGHHSHRQVHTDDPVNPGDLYGVSKCFGEAMCRYMAEQEGLSAIAIRIGAFQPVERAKDADALGMMDAFVSRRDLTRLIQHCIDAAGIRFAIFHGLSNNRFNRMDITTTCELLGYCPEDDFTELNPALDPLDLPQNVSPHDQAGGQKSGIREQL